MVESAGDWWGGGCTEIYWGGFERYIQLVYIPAIAYTANRDWAENPSYGEPLLAVVECCSGHERQMLTHNDR